MTTAPQQNQQQNFVTSTAQSATFNVAADAIDLIPNTQSTDKNALQHSPSRVFNTLEHQMQINQDPWQPRGEPQLVGLTRIRYSKLPEEVYHHQPTQNYIIECSQHFYPNKPSSKKVALMRSHSKKLSLCNKLVAVTVDLPQLMLVEQINLSVDQLSVKRQSDFSKCFQLVSVCGDNQELSLKSAYSECVTRSGKIEYNLCGVTQTLTLVFAVEIQNQAISENQIQIKIQQKADIDLEDRVLAGNEINQIENSDDDDFRILDSLPSMRRTADSKESKFSVFLKSIEVVGFYTIQVPAITNLTYFMNQSFYLQGKGREQEASLVDFMTSQLLVTTKRATQAAEMYRKMQSKELQGLSQGQSQKKYRKYIQCAVYELLIADSLSPNVQLFDKIMSIDRMSSFLRAETPIDIHQRFPAQVSVNKIDSFSSMLNNLPEVLRFAIACLSHRLEIVRISALKMLKYILETLGCSLDHGMVFILKAMLKTYPIEGQKWTQGTEDFDFKKLIGKEITILEFLFKIKDRKQTKPKDPTKWSHLEEPQSGSKRAMINIYNHVLDTFISVLSSVSSHILHAIFYDVIESTLVIDSGYPIEVRVFTCKIADKIFTICQGDLILTPKLLDTLLTLTSNLKPQLPDSVEQTAQSQVKSLWLSIRQKVLPNYSTKGYNCLVNWLVQQLTQIQGVEGQDDRVRQMAEIITIVSLGRQKSEEDANQAIRLPSHERYGGGPSSELYLVLAPLLYWLEYSIDREDRFSLFIQLYQTIKDVLAGLPKGQSDLDIISVIFPSLQRASDFMADNSPSLSMIKFLDLVLSDMLRAYQKNQRTQPPVDIQNFFMELLSNFVSYIPYSLYEETLFVFEKLIALSSDVINEKVLQRCIVALIDKYTVKSKQLKNTVAFFMKFMLNQNNQKKQQSSPTSQRTEALEEMLSEGGGLDHSMNTRSSLFEIMSDFCFFYNQFGKHNTQQTQQHFKQLEFRSQQDIHDLNVEKLQFFIDSLSLISETHIPVFTNLITHPNFRHNLLALIDSGESQVRLKAHEIMESLTQYFVQFCPAQTVYQFPNAQNQNDTIEAEFISHERLYISQIVIQIVKFSLERATDCYLQFNSLILLDFLFQNLLPVPTFQNELLKTQRTRQSQDDNEEITLDVEILSISESTPELDVMDPAYLRMRMKLVFSMWPYVQSALNSPWSNIRSICYGLICSMLRIDIHDYPKEDHAENQRLASNMSYDDSHHASQAGMTHLVLPMLHSLLNSKESESKAGGLNILGSFCGLSYDFSSVRVNKHLAFFQRNSQFVSNQIWNLVWGLQDDWDITIKEASVVLIQLCAPRNAVMYFDSVKEQRELQKLDYLSKMSKVSGVYTAQKKTKSQTDDCPVQSEHAKRAINLFPTQKDCKAVLTNEKSDDISQLSEMMSHEALTFEEFMFSRECSFPPEILQTSQILSMSDDLQAQIKQFSPDFEDKRLTQGANQQQMSRRRQLEMEMGMNPQPKQLQPDTGFFVDQYADDQIQEIISIFRNDFKPPKNLWIEKQPSHSQPSPHQAPQSQSPDFYQDIYSDAIEQFNQHQMMMQQRQQDELQQQVSSGVTSQSSFSSNESKLTIKESEITQTLDDSQNSSTPSPSPSYQARPSETTPPPVVPKKVIPVLGSLNPTAVSTGPWPTSPVLVSSGKQFSQAKKDQPTRHKKNSLQIEQLNLDAITIKPQVPIKKEIYESNTRLNQDSSKQLQNSHKNSSDNLNNQPQQEQFQTKSESDFTNIQLKQHSPRQNKKTKASKEDLMTSPGSSDQNKISRKTAQTYLSNLNQGYIQNFDNLKLINNCLSQQNMPQSPTSPNSILNLTVNNSSQDKKLSIKTVASPDSGVVVQHGSTKSRKKQTISNSPENAHHHRKQSKKKTHQLSYKSNVGKQMNNLADLNYFIKSLEKGMSNPTTPNNLIKKVEDQMRALGVDPKMYKHVDPSHKDRPMPPQMKLLALNQIAMRASDEQMTPSSQQTLKRLNQKQQSSSPKRLVKSNDSDSDFSKTQRYEKKQGSILDKQSKHRESDSHEGQNSGRGGGTSYTVLNQPAILTERSNQHGQVLLGFKNQAPGKQSNSTRYDSAGLFQFKKGNSKSQQKGYGALASKSVISPNMMKREHQQSGGLISGKLNLSANQTQTQSKATTAVTTTTNQHPKKQKEAKVTFHGKGGTQQDGDQKRPPQSTRNIEQGGDRKQLMSPDPRDGQPKLTQNKKKRAGHSHNNSSGVTKPALVLQQPSYY